MIFFLNYFLILFVPTTNENGGISFINIDPPAITEPKPIQTFPKIFTSAPNHSSSIKILILYNPYYNSYFYQFFQICDYLKMQ